MSFGAGLASAGIGMKVNYDSASECKRSASRLRTSAEDKRSTARSKKTLKGELESKKILKNTELQLNQTKIGIYFCQYDVNPFVIKCMFVYLLLCTHSYIYTYDFKLILHLL
jgi:hypothetical protein